MINRFNKLAIVILSVIILLTLPACDEEPTSPDGYGKFSIITDKNVYSWYRGEGKDHIIIQGQLENKSGSIFYAKLGDFVNSSSEQEELLIASNSAGYIEKYNESSNSWYEINILSTLIEGSNFVHIKPSEMYSIYGDLIKNNDTEENGIYRLRIDYFNHEHTDSSVSPFQDYSNTFMIE